MMHLLFLYAIAELFYTFSVKTFVFLNLYCLLCSNGICSDTPNDTNRSEPNKNAKKREFEIKSKNSKLSVIDKVNVNGGLLFKKAVCCYSRQRIGYKVIE